jgi:NAD(P)-dependent dehydrogenase (short-subunit alcohol dehydrogenase family)
MAKGQPRSDRVVVISGAGTGIGQASAVRFAEAGWSVGIGGRRVERLDETKSLVETAGGRCLSHRLEVADSASVEQFFTTIESRFGTVDAVVNNAAVGQYLPLEDFPPEEIEREVATKLLGSLYMARRAIRGMRAGGTGGDILFVTSRAAAEPWPLHLPYAAASAGVEQAARTLRLELEGSGIRVSTLRCGETAGTEFGLHEQMTGRGLAASERWFRRGLLRHTGLMTPRMVAEAIFAAVTATEGCQYEMLTVAPSAPVGDPPPTFAEWREEMARLHTPSSD